MAEKLFTGTLNKNKKINKKISQSWYQFFESFLDSFDTINVFAQIRMPHSISILQLGANHRLVKSDIGILVKVVKGSDNES